MQPQIHWNKQLILLEEGTQTDNSLNEFMVKHQSWLENQLILQIRVVIGGAMKSKKYQGALYSNQKMFS